MNAPRLDAGHQRWPPERFYWAVLEAPGYARRGPLPLGVQAALEDQLPVPADEVHAVGAPLGGGRLLVCAAPRSALRALTPAVISLTPESSPPLGAETPSVIDLNLLVGPFEPLPIRRARNRRHLLGLATLAVCTVLIGVGLWRRTERWTVISQHAREATDSIVTSAAAGPTADHLALELVRRRAGSGPRTTSPDVAVALSALLAAWPAQLPSRPQSITVDASGVTLAVLVDGDPGPFLQAFKPPSGWALEEPRLNSAGSVTRLNLRLRSKGPSS